MQRINLQASQSLAWIQPRALCHSWELTQNGQVVGTMALKSRFSSRAVAESAEGSWRMGQPRFFSSDIHVEKDGVPGDVALAHQSWRGNGMIKFADGKQYAWKRTGFFRGTWHVTDEIGQEFLTITERGRFFRAESDVQISPFAGNNSHLPVIVALMWYLVQIQRRRGAAVAASV